METNNEPDGTKADATVFQFLYPLRGWKLLFTSSFLTTISSFNSFTPYGDGNCKHFPGTIFPPFGVSIPLPLTGMETGGTGRLGGVGVVFVSIPLPLTGMETAMCWEKLPPLDTQIVSIPLPLTGMETVAKMVFVVLESVSIPLPLTGMETNNGF